MNVGIVTSFIIAGMMILSIFAFNRSVYDSSAEATLTTATQNQLDNLVTILTNDFNRIGYKSSVSDNISTATSGEVEFEGDIYDNDVQGSTTVRWFFDTAAPDTSTTNPNDYYLKRTGPVSSGVNATSEFSVTHFELTYYAGDGSVTNNPALVKRIDVEIIVQSKEPVNTSAGNTKTYHVSVWKKTFVPNNINLPY